jgi:hypothetical protein
MLALVIAPTAVADEASGTFTGSIEARGSYYWEPSTRIVAPTLIANVQTPSGTSFGAVYLVDTITSASIAAGALADVRFVEARHDVTGRVSHELDLGTRQLRLGASPRVSKEPDYLSTSVNVSAALSLAERNTVLHAALTVLHDEVRQNFRTGSQVRPGTGGTSAARFEEHFNAILGSLGWEQVLSPTTIAFVSAEMAWLDGYLANPYRQVQVQGVLRPESHPPSRYRYTLSGRLAQYIPATHTAVHLLYRAYLDDWNVAALTPEIRLYQEVSTLAQVRLRYRYYRQTRSFFAGTQAYTLEDRFFTADPKMTAFEAHQLGFQLILSLDFLAGTTLERLRGTTIELDFDYRWNTNRFGNAVISQAAMRVPF